MRKKKLINILNNFKNKRIAVVGDLMIDVYIWGRATRISPEAPVPVVHVKRRTSTLGGAANVMRNIITMGGEVEAFGILGHDARGDELVKLLKEYNINTESICFDENWTTIEKQRIIADSQQLMRIDYEDLHPVADSIREKIANDLIDLIKKNHLDAIIFEDYAKGMLNDTMVQKVVDVAKQHNCITALDPNPRHLMNIKDLTVMKPNRLEAFAIAGMVYTEPTANVEDDENLHQVAKVLMERYNPKYLLISLAAQGMAIFKRDGSLTVSPTRAYEVFDVSGAGDTVISAFSLALAAGANSSDAAEIANHAAGVVVEKVGTVTVTKDELLASFDNKTIF
ncbi:bifunctional ADP-heptose synthase [Lentisphaerota bacterium WC36G]|nr:PfkB family carbohydrate kinase [Lentisphaerae bacterium WC36]